MWRNLRRPRVASDGHEAGRPAGSTWKERKQMSYTKAGKTWEAMVPGERRTLAAARLGWGVLVGLSLLLFTLSVPARYEELTELASRASAQLGPAGALHGILSEGF